MISGNSRHFRLTDTGILVATAALAMLVWAFHSTFWWAHLEGDAPLYPLLSVKVLEGRHFLMTEGQAHGGTLLIYLRALLFKLFGISFFTGFFVNGFFVALGSALWARFALKYSGRTAAIVMGLLGAVATERFARSACTDYFVFTLFSSGLMLNLAHRLAHQPRILGRDAWVVGLVAGFSWYICRFSALYLVSSVLFYLGMLSEKRRLAYLPSRAELTATPARRAVLAIVPIGLLLSVIAFFTNDRFLGINAEANLKVFVGLSALIWAGYRWHVIAQSGRNIAAAVFGLALGIAPELIFKLGGGRKDRSTGLVRWGDLEPYLRELPARVGENFAFYHPLTLGVAGALCATALVALGHWGPERRRHWQVALPVVLCTGSWLSIHTYMHLPTQYFFPVFYPLYLAAAFAVAHSRFRKSAIALTAALFAIGLADVAQNALVPNEIAEAGVLERLETWGTKYGITEGFGQMASNYNIMWAAKGRLFLPKVRDDERFQVDQERVWAQSRVFYVHHEKDRFGIELPRGYRVLEHDTLPHGFDIYVLEKNHES